MVNFFGIPFSSVPINMDAISLGRLCREIETIMREGQPRVTGKRFPVNLDDFRYYVLMRKLQYDASIGQLQLPYKEFYAL